MQRASQSIEQLRAAYQRDGAVAVRGALGATWVERMRGAIARLSAEQPAATIWMARCDGAFDALVRESGLAELARRLMAVDQVRFFYDQLLVKPPQSDLPTPLHHDLPYWPIEGAEMISIWVAFDDVTMENSAVQYLRGSHLWRRKFRPDPNAREFAAHGDAPDGYEDMADPAALIAESEILWWPLAPGDVLAHHPLTLHFATPNTSAHLNRRAIVLRFVGPGARFIALPGDFTQWADRPAHWPPPVTVGAAMDGPDYPVVWCSTS